jgi:hypothetical protein
MEIEILKTLGLAGGFLVIFLVYHAAQRKADKRIYDTQVKALEAIIKEYAEREVRNFSLLKELIDQQNYQSAALARMEQKIDSNMQCPVVRGDKQ